MTIRVGHISTGWMGKEILEKFLMHPDVEVVAIFEPDATSRAGALERLGKNGLTNRMFVDSYEKLLRVVGEGGAVSIVSPSMYHGQAVISALERGIHTFVEKPNATNFKDAAREIELDRQLNLVTMTDYILRFDDMEKKLHQLLLQRIFGDILFFDLNYRHAIKLVGDDPWKCKVEAIGMGPVHCIDLMLWHMMSVGYDVENVRAIGLEPSFEMFKVKPGYNITIKFRNQENEKAAVGNIKGHVEVDNGYDTSHFVYGSKGYFEFRSLPGRTLEKEDLFKQELMKTRVTYKSRMINDGNEIFPLLDGKAPMDHLWPREMSFPDSGDVIHHKTKESVDHFVDCIQKNEKSPLGFSNSARTTEVTWAALYSANALEGETVHFPLCYQTVFEAGNISGRVKLF